MSENSLFQSLQSWNDLLAQQSKQQEKIDALARGALGALGPAKPDAAAAEKVGEVNPDDKAAVVDGGKITVDFVKNAQSRSIFGPKFPLAEEEINEDNIFNCFLPFPGDGSAMSKSMLEKRFPGDSEKSPFKDSKKLPIDVDVYSKTGEVGGSGDHMYTDDGRNPLSPPYADGSSHFFGHMSKKRCPRTYKYNPKPVQQKSNRAFVPDYLKDEDYWQYRRRNNEAAKKSRQDRRSKEMEIVSNVKGLRDENEKLWKENMTLSAENVKLMRRNLELEKEAFECNKHSK